MGGKPARAELDLSTEERFPLACKQYAQLGELFHTCLRSRRPVGYHLDLLAESYQKPPHGVRVEVVCPQMTSQSGEVLGYGGKLRAIQD